MIVSEKDYSIKYKHLTSIVFKDCIYSSKDFSDNDIKFMLYLIYRTRKNCLLYSLPKEIMINNLLMSEFIKPFSIFVESKYDNNNNNSSNFNSSSSSSSSDSIQNYKLYYFNSVYNYDLLKSNNSTYLYTCDSSISKIVDKRSNKELIIIDNKYSSYKLNLLSSINNSRIECSILSTDFLKSIENNLNIIEYNFNQSTSNKYLLNKYEDDNHFLEIYFNNNFEFNTINISITGHFGKEAQFTKL